MRKAAVVAAMLALFGAISIGAGETGQAVAVQDLVSKKVVVVGELGKKIGTYVTVEAKCHGQPTMTERSGLEISKVDGQELKKPVWLAAVYKEKQLEKGRTYTLRGYEAFTTAGQPDDPLNPPSKQEVQGRQAVAPPELAIEPFFVVTKAEEVGASR